MPYDISIFITIASLSASFVAILGGFIASKLITVNGERERITGEIEEIDLQLDIKTEERDRLQKGSDEEDALDFIRDNDKKGTSPFVTSPFVRPIVRTYRNKICFVLRIIISF